MQDLNSILDSSGADWTLGVAEDINDAGQIVGWGVLDDVIDCSAETPCEGVSLPHQF